MVSIVGSKSTWELLPLSRSITPSTVKLERATPPPLTCMEPKVPLALLVHWRLVFARTPFPQFALGGGGADLHQLEEESRKGVREGGTGRVSPLRRNRRGLGAGHPGSLLHRCRRSPVAGNVPIGPRN